LLHFGGDIADFADTAAIVSLLDLLITVDTGPAHIAGALGRPVWLLLPQRSEWRWLRDRADSPWYPGVMRLFRQPPDAPSWDGEIRTVAAALASRVQSEGIAILKPLD
jgi:ADP-heptose:LPS heptosyltransferase